jgi:alpha,alpha-trehalase
MEPSILLRDVQMQRIFPDGKTFPDCIPNDTTESIEKNYLQEKDQPGFDLKKFVHEHFQEPVVLSNGYRSDAGKTLEENIGLLWPFLTRQPDKVSGSLIPLPYPYVVPGGRFGEIYYWDSYFTMLGLKISGKTDMLKNMVNNFSYLIDSLGYIPNGNRSYFIGRSQPPFYSLMVRLLASEEGSGILQTYLPQLEKEYLFWMKGADQLSATNRMFHHAVLLPGGELLNRYWDENETPRPESFREDVELSHISDQEIKKLFRQLRAGAESGWDYSSRWFKDVHSFASIHTTDIVPVDLNCLLLHLEQTIAEAHQLNGNQETFQRFQALAARRKEAIQKYCWNEKAGFYFDYDAVQNQQKKSLTLAGAFPLFVQLANADQAKQVATTIQKKFLQAGGLTSTLETTGQQWDAPNGWAPLQWTTIAGLEYYGYDALAGEIARRWIRLNAEVFKRTGKLMEIYNVVNTNLEAGGGEYAGQDGFGWTNGVLLALMKKFGSPD